MAVLKSGNIVEQGRHSELMGRPDGAYATLLKLQMTASRQRPDATEDQTSGDTAAATADDVVDVRPPATEEVHAPFAVRCMCCMWYIVSTLQYQKGRAGTAGRTS